MADTRAFKLAAGSEEDFSGGTFSYGSNGEMFDVGEALGADQPENEETGLPELTGTIVTDNPVLINALLNYQFVEEVDVPEGAQPIETEVEAPPDTMTPTPPAPDVPAEHTDEEVTDGEFGNE